LSRKFAEITNNPITERTRGRKKDYYSMMNPKDLDSPPTKNSQKPRVEKN